MGGKELNFSERHIHGFLQAKFTSGPLDKILCRTYAHETQGIADPVVMASVRQQ